jgi:creatinine amidohydrolase/Fe(II)-dependent formamide hydrolase-like protein
VVLLPAIPHGYDPHHMDFPGAITIGWDTFTATSPTSAARWPITASGGCCS